MSPRYQPPFTLTTKIVSQVATVAERIGRLGDTTDPVADPVSDPVDQLSRALASGPLAPSMLLSRLGLQQRPTFRSTESRPRLSRVMRRPAQRARALDALTSAGLAVNMRGTGISR